MALWKYNVLPFLIIYKDVDASSEFFEDVAQLQLQLETEKQAEVQHQPVVQAQAEITGNDQEHMNIEANVEVQKHLMLVHTESE